MPMDYYGYYTMLEPFAAAYYEVGEKPKHANYSIN